jgi:hypothetical protein
VNNTFGQNIVIRHFSQWLSDDPAKWSVAMHRYKKYIKDKKDVLPRKLLELVDQFTLHDGSIASITQVTGGRNAHDVILIVRSPKNGWIRDTDRILVIMHLIGVRGKITARVPLAKIMYYDVEIASTGLFQISFALENRKKWSVRFAEFGYYVHDYRE